ncbi:MarR family winged helix-turn-helix transcriptional regulator [Mycolicibacterium sp. XJ1819]
MYSVWLTEEQQRVWRRYLTMTGRLQAAMNRQLQRDCGLSLADYEVLVVLAERGAQRITHLADVLAWEQSRLSHQLRRMRERGLVTRTSSDDDRRGATTDLTQDGHAALRAASAGHAELVRSVVFEGMSQTQLRAVGSWTEAVLARLATSPTRRT